MFDWFFCLETSDKISLISTISSFCLAFVAIWQSQQSIKLTQQSIFEANRPIIVAYMDTVNVDSVDKFLIIKNFGNTSAMITKIETENLKVHLQLDRRLQNISNISFAPNQKLVTELIPVGGLQAHIEPFKVSIDYHDVSGQRFSETFSINPEFTQAIVTARKELKNLSTSDKNISEIASALIKELK